MVSWSNGQGLDHRTHGGIVQGEGGMMGGGEGKAQLSLSAKVDDSVGFF